MNLHELQLVSALIAGLFGSLHCIAMCGGIATALGVSTASDKSQSLALMYQIGRISSYGIAGAIVAFLGTQLTDQVAGEGFKSALRIASVAFMMGLGLYLAGWFPAFAKIERIGLPIWRKISPISKKLIPITSHWRALLLGLLWGWLPCGLVYSVLLWAVTAPDPVSGAMVMVAFGLGTLPAMYAMSLGASRLLIYLSQPMIRRIAGSTILLLALYSISSYFEWL